MGERGRTRRRLAAAIASVGLLGLVPAAVHAEEQAWVRQFGTSAGDQVLGVAADDAGVTVVGYTLGALPEKTSAGMADAFVRRYDRAGNVLWTEQFGSAQHDVAYAVAADDQGVVITGYVSGALPGETYLGLGDAFIRRYTRSGTPEWHDQFGSNGFDSALGITTDATGITITGYTTGTLPGKAAAGYEDAFVRRYDRSGAVMWTDQFGSASYDRAKAVASDDGGVTIAGNTSGRLAPETGAGEADMFLRRYDQYGAVLWTDQFGTEGSEEAYGIAADDSGIVVGGYTTRAFPGEANAGDVDAVVRRYDRAGAVDWTDQFGTTTFDQVSGVAIAEDGVIVTGYTSGTLSGEVWSGGTDAFVRRYDEAGRARWTDQFGSAGSERPTGVAVDDGGIVVGGLTYGSLGGTSAGAEDAFVRRSVELGPRGTVSINGGGAWTNTTAVTLALSATDPSGVRRVRISNVRHALDGVLSVGRTYRYSGPSSALPWDLADEAVGGSATNGTRAVYVQYQDGAGIWSPIISDTIGLDTVRPVARPPSDNFVTGQRLGGFDVPVRIAWAHQVEATSGIAAYGLQQSADGGSTWSSVALPSPTAMSIDRPLAPGSTSYRFRSFATDRAGNISSPATGAAFRVHAHQESSTSIAYSGSWSPPTPVNDAYGGYVRFASGAGAVARLTWTGRDVAVVSTKGRDRGRAEVWIDGSRFATVDLYSATTGTRLIIAARDLPYGTHTVELRALGTGNASATGTRVDVDVFVVLG